MTNRLKHVSDRRGRRSSRVRTHVTGNSDRPRLHVTVSNKHVSAQIIDDTQHTTLVSSSTVGKKSVKGTLTEKAQWVGTDIAKKAQAKKIAHVVYDRGAKLYHGRVKALADAAREAGLEF